MPPRKVITRSETGIVVWPRATFFYEVFDYTPGDHCTFLAPTGGGKTQIALQALEAVVSPKLRATIFVMKPKDETISRFIRAHPKRWETIRDYPPPTLSVAKRAFGEKLDGYVLWPRETGNAREDDERHQDVFGRALDGLYISAKKEPNIAFCDETFSLEQELKLTTELRRAWTKGRSVGNGIWGATQRPAYISLWAYQAQHLFIGFDPDEKSQDRYAEIGAGIDPTTVKALINSLQRYEFLYINREERAMCIIGAD